jgi:hypothetical protein
MINDVYGSQLTTEQVRGAIAQALDATFDEHESYFRGRYLVASLDDDTHVEIQPNTVPGDDEEEYYATEYAAYLVLLLVRGDRLDDVRRRLEPINGLTYLRQG